MNNDLSGNSTFTEEAKNRLYSGFAYMTYLLVSAVVVLGIVWWAVTAFLGCDSENVETAESLTVSALEQTVKWHESQGVDEQREKEAIAKFLSVVWGGEWWDYYSWSERRYPDWTALYPDNETRMRKIFDALVNKASEDPNWDRSAMLQRAEQTPVQIGFWQDYFNEQ